MAASGSAASAAASLVQYVGGHPAAPAAPVLRSLVQGHGDQGLVVVRDQARGVVGLGASRRRRPGRGVVDVGHRAALLPDGVSHDRVRRWCGDRPCAMSGRRPSPAPRPGRRLSRGRSPVWPVARVRRGCRVSVFPRSPRPSRRRGRALRPRRLRRRAVGALCAAGRPPPLRVAPHALASVRRQVRPRPAHRHGRLAAGAAPDLPDMRVRSHRRCGVRGHTGGDGDAEVRGHAGDRHRRNGQWFDWGSPEAPPSPAARRTAPDGCPAAAPGAACRSASGWPSRGGRAARIEPAPGGRVHLSKSTPRSLVRGSTGTTS
jgi:hypothetical protein